MLDSRVAELEAALGRVERERDGFKKALVVFGRNEGNVCDLLVESSPETRNPLSDNHLSNRHQSYRL